MTKQEEARARIAARMEKHKQNSDETAAAPWLGDRGVPDELKKKFYDFLNKHKKLPETVFGVFGEMAGRNGWVEKIIRFDGEKYQTKVFGGDEWGNAIKEDWFPKEQGVFIKLFGNSFLFKGYLSKASVEGIEQAKSLLFQVPKNLPFFTALGLGFDYLFRRRKFWAFVDWILQEVDQKTLKHYQVPPEEYNVFAVELFRAAIHALYKVFGIDLSRPAYYPGHPRWDKNRYVLDPQDNTGKNYLGHIIGRGLFFIIFFLQNDFAYRARFQDALSVGPKNAEELLKVLLSRELGIGAKWKFLLKNVKIILWFEPKLKEFFDEFFREMDLKKVSPDEADKYFSLMYSSYNFGGKPLKERKAEWNEINEKKSHRFLFSMPDLV